MRVSIAGGSGFVGGELLRLLVDHPDVTVAQVTSERHARKLVRSVHPHLRGRCDLTFTALDDLDPCDLLITALPHGQAVERIEAFAALAPKVIDCSGDFRLDAATWERTRGEPHPRPEWADRFVYGLPEVHRDAIAGADHVSGVGCNATAANLALLAMARSGLLDLSKPITCEVKAGSSEAGNAASSASHHPTRSGVVRAFAPVGHRHEAEVRAVLGLEDVHLSVTSIELVRGAAACAQAWLKEPVPDKEIWRVYREIWSAEPFVRVVHERGGLYRHPEPRLLAGTNFADVGWTVDPDTGRIALLSALDNLGKGAAGSAVQCLNLMAGLEEGAGLSFGGLWP